jgi:hypothetical protein
MRLKGEIIGKLEQKKWPGIRGIKNQWVRAEGAG